MATFSRKGWSSDGEGSGLSADEYTRYMDDLDDAIMLRCDSGSRPGKTIHLHRPFREKITVDDKARFDGLKEAAENGITKAWFPLGQEYAKRGEWAQAEHWLGKAADLGCWPEAVEALLLVRQLKQLYERTCDENADKEHSDEAVVAIPSEEHPFLKLPRIAGFETCEIVIRRGVKQYLVLVRRKKSVNAKREVMGHVLREAGFDDATDLYDTELDARNAGLLARRSWGRLISQEKETRFHLRDSIEKFLSDISR